MKIQDKKEIIEQINKIRDSLGTIEKEMNNIRGILFDINFEIVTIEHFDN